MLRSKALQIFIGAVFTLILIIGGLFVIVYLGAPKRYNVLIIGSDQRGTERARSDVLMVFSIPKSPNQPLSLITIPRDTRVEVPGYDTQKITHAYALAEREDNSVLGNTALTKQTVKNFLDIPIHATVEFTFESFKNLVDEFGGVDTDSGWVNGEEALKIVRNRYREGGDFARTHDQREIFLDLGQKANTPPGLKKLYTFFTSNSQTRLRYQQLQTVMFGLAAYIRRGGKFDLTNTYTDFIPGHGQTLYTPEFKANLYYWVPDQEKTKKLVDKRLK